jgi:phage terminase large subunit-like protein
MNADAKIDDTGHKLRIVKRQSHLKIDAAVALSMAAYRALELNLY